MIGATEWSREIARLAAAGAGFGCLYAADDDAAGRRVTAVLETAEGPRALTCRVAEGGVPTIVGSFPAAEWDEREAHDLYGIEFAGHEPLRPLVAHTAEARGWMTPVEGRDVHQVAVGPIHAGVIESGHFRFHVVGERVLALDLRLFYKHRGLERLAEGQDAAGSLRVAGSICAASSASIQIALAQSWEACRSLLADRELRRARTVLIELERLYNHLNDLGAICAGVGYSPGAMAFASLKERAQRLNAELCGHRFLFGAVAVGRSDLAVDHERAAAARAEVEAIAAEAARFWREILFSVSIQERFRGAGSVDLATAERLSLVGPAARASGLVRDRRTRPGTGLAYAGDFEPARPEVAGGDVAARAEIRAVEIAQSCRILDQLLAEPLRPGTAEPAAAAERSETAAEEVAARTPGGPWVASVEGPRGETVCALEVAAERVSRLHFRTASYRNWPAIQQAVIGDILPDFPLINKSFELSYAAVDR